MEDGSPPAPIFAAVWFRRRRPASLSTGHFEKTLNCLKVSGREMPRCECSTHFLCKYLKCFARLQSRAAGDACFREIRDRPTQLGLRDPGIQGIFSDIRRADTNELKEKAGDRRLHPTKFRPRRRPGPVSVAKVYWIEQRMSVDGRQGWRSLGWHIADLMIITKFLAMAYPHNAVARRKNSSMRSKLGLRKRKMVIIGL